MSAGDVTVSGAAVPGPGGVAAALSPIALPDVDGREVRLGALWAERPVVLEFLRHYG